MEGRKFKIEWGLSLLNKYGTIIIEGQLRNLDITKTQALLIIHLSQKSEIHQNQLASIFKMNRSTVTRAINLLESKDLVNKMIDKENKKANIISLTASGKVALNEINNAIEQWTTILMKDFSGDEIKLCETFIIKMASNACEYVGDNRLAELISKQ